MQPCANAAWISAKLCPVSGKKRVAYPLNSNHRCGADRNTGEFGAIQYRGRIGQDIYWQTLCCIRANTCIDCAPHCRLVAIVQRPKRGVPA
jgi:hypothetical protein